MKLLDFLRPKDKKIIILTEEQAKQKISSWKDILKTQDEAMDKIEKGLKIGKDWLEKLPPRVKTTKNELEVIKNEIKSSHTEQSLLIVGKKFISKKRLLETLLMASKTMIGNLRMADLQLQRLQDKAVELATRIQESEVYLSLAGSLEVASKFIEEIERPISKDNISSLIQFKSVTLGLNKEDEITDEEVRKVLRKEFTRVIRGNNRGADKRDSNSIKTRKSKSNS